MSVYECVQVCECERVCVRERGESGFEWGVSKMMERIVRVLPLACARLRVFKDPFLQRI